MEEIFLFSIFGFLASLIDGCIGMAYGVFLTSVLTASGIPLLTASAGIHFSEIFTTFISGISHLSFKNIDFNLLKKIAITGALGGIIGALTLANIDNVSLKPFVAVYLFLLGVKIIYKSLKNQQKEKSTTHLKKIGFIGGFFDAVGGGGWGPIVTGTLISKGHTPAKTIGTVNLAEFFVTLAQSIIFFTVINLTSFNLVIGLILGAAIASPIAVIITKKVNSTKLMRYVGSTIILINLFVLINIVKDLL